MQVVLTPRYLLTEEGESVFLRDRRTGIKIWPEDVFQPFPTWGFRPAADHASRMARSAMLKPPERELVERFRNAVPADSPTPPAAGGPDVRIIES